MSFTAPELIQLPHGHLGGRVGGGGYGKGYKHLVHVQPGIVVAKVIHLQILYGLYHYGGYEVHILLYPAQALECVEQHGSRSAKELSGLSGDYLAAGQLYRRGRLPGLLRYPETSLTPHSIYSVQDALFREICAEGDEPLSIHFMETPAEAELFEQRGELWEWYRKAGFTCDFLHYGSPARRIVESVPADRSVILIHNCCVNQQDIDLIMNHFTAPVWWCLCPGSNRYISRLVPPVELLRRNGLNICLGTDSLASNTALSLLGEMQHLGKIPLAELLTWAAPNGARALGFSELGEVAAGKRPWLAVLSGLDYDSMTLTPASCIARIL